MTQPNTPNAHPQRGNALSRWIGNIVLKIMGWKIKGQLPNSRKTLIIGAAHTSNWDFVIGIAAMLALNLNTNWMGKSNMFVWPFRRFFMWLGGIPTERTKNTGAVEAKIKLFTESDQLYIAIAPEGTRSATTQWRTGFYHIADGANVPIFPIGWDFPNKTLHLLPMFHTTGNKDADIKALQALYKDITPCFPEKAEWIPKD